jgi:hypothetical protein
MYIQWFVKGIAGQADSNSGTALTWPQAKQLLSGGHGIDSNWWRNKPNRLITPSEIDAILTEHNLDRHVHDYQNYGQQTPFISVASGCVERDTLMSQNFVYSAVTTALDFATDAWSRPGALFYGWLPVALNPAVPISAVAEEIRDLNVYHRWSPFQLEGEVTAKVHIPSNQIKAVEWWDGNADPNKPVDRFENPSFIEPTPITNVREHF